MRFTFSTCLNWLCFMIDASKLCVLSALIGPESPWTIFDKPLDLFNSCASSIAKAFRQHKDDQPLRLERGYLDCRTCRPRGTTKLAMMAASSAGLQILHQTNQITAWEKNEDARGSCHQTHFKCHQLRRGSRKCPTNTYQHPTNHLSDQLGCGHMTSAGACRKRSITAGKKRKIVAPSTGQYHQLPVTARCDSATVIGFVSETIEKIRFKRQQAQLSVRLTAQVAIHQHPLSSKKGHCRCFFDSFANAPR